MGIGGAGISAVAFLAKNAGFEVTGCDLETSRITGRLEKAGIPVALGHNASHLENVDLLVHTPAVFYQSELNPEYQQALGQKKALIWEEFMAQNLHPGKFVIAVSGTHGKGTTSAMLSRILEEADLDPICEIGANLLDWDRRNYRVGQGTYFVCEADEFRDKFLLYKPSLAVITSIDMDHPEYFKNLAAIISSFQKFVHRLTGPKILIINASDLGCQLLLKNLNKEKFAGKIITYSAPKKFSLRLPGSHIQADATAAYLAATALGIKSTLATKTLESFSGLERRMEYRGQVQGAKIYDDYAHHPTAIAANLKAAKKHFPGRRIWAVFQPHMYSRLQALFPDFVQALKMADKVVVTDVYSRREQNITKPSGKDLALAVGSPKATYVGGDVVNVANFLARNAGKNDVLLLMGAGDVYKISDLLLK